MAVVVVNGGRAMRGGRTVLRNESAADGMAAAVGTVLRQGGKREHHDCQGQSGSKNGKVTFHGHLQRLRLPPAFVSNTALTILCRLRYRKDFGGRVVARLMAWRPR